MREVLARIKSLFGTVVVYPSSGTGAWEAALANVLSTGDRVLAFETGHFATVWCQLAERVGLVAEFVPGDWRRGIDPAVVADRLAAEAAYLLFGLREALLLLEEERLSHVFARHRLERAGVAVDSAGIQAALEVLGAE